MREVTTNIELDAEVLVDIDVLAEHSYIAITDKGNVVFPFEKIEVRQLFMNGRFVSSGQKGFTILDLNQNHGWQQKPNVGSNFTFER